MSSQYHEHPTNVSILFVDDEQNIIRAIQRIFRDENYTIYTALSSADALQILESTPIDLVVVDLNLPGMNGVDLLTQISQRWPDTMRILFTGSPDLKHIIEAINKGSIYKYIAKPWNDIDFKLTVQQTLNVKFLAEEKERLLKINQDQVTQLSILNDQLNTEIRDRIRLATQLDEQLAIAREIQQHLLPIEPLQNGKITGINIAATVLSGDFYDYFTLDDGRIFFTLGDVSGKGVYAALLMAKTIGLFRCLGKELRQLLPVCSILNREICNTSIRGMFVTMVAGLYDPETHIIRMINAGHLPPIVCSEKFLPKYIESESLPLGIIEGNEFEEVEFNLNNSSLYLYSDGITESGIHDDGPLETDGLLELIDRYTHLQPPQRLEKIMTHVCDSQSQFHDDMTILIIDNVN